MFKAVKWALMLGLLIEVDANAAAVEFPQKFDELGPTVQRIEAPEGRPIHFIDDGDPLGQAVVFTGGLGTSVRAIRLLDFLQTLRSDLGLRFITVERNGFGQTPFDPSLTMTNFSEDVERVLAHLKVKKFSVFGISGGGPYTQKIASRNPERLHSVHLAATAPSLGGGQRCSADSPASAYRDLLRYPMQFFAFESDSPMHQVTGFQDTAFDEGARAHFMRGQLADPMPLDHEIKLYCQEGLIDMSPVKVPVFVYAGLSDAVLGAQSLEVWRDVFPQAAVTIRAYPDEGHDIQYRHLDQILLDLAGYGDQTLVCKKGIAELIPNSSTKAVLKQGAQLGLCAW